MDKSTAKKLVKMGYSQFDDEQIDRVIEAFKKKPEKVLLNGSITDFKGKW